MLQQMKIFKTINTSTIKTYNYILNINQQTLLLNDYLHYVTNEKLYHFIAY